MGQTSQLLKASNMHSIGEGKGGGERERGEGERRGGGERGRGEGEGEGRGGGERGHYPAITCISVHFRGY